jgi:hypothetical protein
LAHVDVRGEAIFSSDVADAEHPTSTVVMLVTVSLSFITGSADITEHGVSGRYRTVSRPFDTTNIHIRRPTVKVTNVALADEVSRTFLIAVAVSDILFTGAAQ